METLFSQLKDKLREKNIKLSYQRFKVLEYLSQNKSHPTVDQIYTELHKSVPTLSKTTIYNTLRVLTDAGLVRVITIEDNETRYDIEIEDHGHFKCELCQRIYNFSINMDYLDSEDLYSFQIKDKNVYFKGICPDCLSNIDKTGKEE